MKQIKNKKRQIKEKTKIEHSKGRKNKIRMKTGKKEKENKENYKGRKNKIRMKTLKT